MQDDLEDDDSHPIPKVRTLDVCGIKEDGGATLVVMIATPMQADARSQRRLLGKIETYLAYLHDPEHLAEAGPPSVDSTEIVIKLHPDSHPKITMLIERAIPWAAENDAALRLAPLDEALVPGFEPGAN